MDLNGGTTNLFDVDTKKGVHALKSFNRPKFSFVCNAHSLDASLLKQDVIYPEGTTTIKNITFSKRRNTGLWVSKDKWKNHSEPEFDIPPPPPKSPDQFCFVGQEYWLPNWTFLHVWYHDDNNFAVSLSSPPPISFLVMEWPSGQASYWPQVQ